MRTAFTVAASCLLGVVRIAAADENGPAPASSQASEGLSDSIAEVTVTARKFAERLQDVPASIVALSAKQIEESGATTLEDIGRQTPGLNIVSAGPGQNSLIIRGLSSNGAGSPVGYYIDDIPLGGSTNVASTNALDPILFDLARVEVLRGPQGTLYGAGAMGGTVKYVTEQPDLVQSTGRVKFTTSATDGSGKLNTEVDAVANMPLVPNVAALRVAAFYRYNDGYIDRYNTNPASFLEVLPGVADRDVNAENTYGARVALTVQPLDWLTFTPSAFVQRRRLGGESAFDAPPGSFDHPIQNRLFEEPILDEFGLYSFNVRGNFGNVSITSETSYLNRRFNITEDESKIDYYFFGPEPQSSVYPSPFYLQYPNHNFTEELRAAIETSRVHAIVGLFYQRVAGSSTVNWILPQGYNAAFGNPFPGESYIYYSTQQLVDAQKALFGEVNFDLTSQLKATLGGRAYRQTQRQAIFATGVFQGGTLTQGANSKVSGFTPKYSVSYAVTPDVMAYATASKGYREGGTFTPVPGDVCGASLAQLGLKSAPTQYNPDSLWNYELGAKTEWLDRRLTVNVDVYDIEWKQIQQSVGLACGFYFIGNFGTATSKGVESEIQYRLMPGLNLGLATAYNTAKLTSTVIGTPGVAGQTLPNAPKWTGNASIEYRPQVGSVKLLARADFNTSSYSYNGFNLVQNHPIRAGYSLLNARLGASFGRIDASLFATNVLNKYAEMGLPISYGSTIPPQAQIALGRPRTVGVDFAVNY